MESDYDSYDNDYESTSETDKYDSDYSSSDEKLSFYG